MRATSCQPSSSRTSSSSVPSHSAMRSRIASVGHSFGPWQLAVSRSSRSSSRNRNVTRTCGAGWRRALVQGVLKDPVETEVDSGSQRSRLAVHQQLDWLTALARALDQGVDLSDARLRLAPCSIIAVAQDSEEAAHLGERLAAGVLDRAHRDVSSRGSSASMPRAPSA